MNRRCARVSASCFGFTLIEILAVVVIIGLLAAMISTAIMLAKRKALEVGRTTQAAAIESAVNNYRYEYQDWPCDETEKANPTSRVYMADNYIVIQDWMMHPSHNTRQIKFLNLADYKFDTDSNIVDYQYKPFSIKIDFTNDTVTVY